jgi:hypothetical protein
MGFGSRIFFFEDDGTLRSVPWSRYDRLYKRDPSVLFPEYAGKAVKCVSVVIELENRISLSVLRTNFFITHFDKRGLIDRTRKEEALRLAVNMTGPDLSDPCGPVIDAHQRLSAKVYRDRFTWIPTREEEEKIERRLDRMFAGHKK